MSQNGFYKGQVSETECKRMCVELAVCVAVDMNNGVCLLVNNLVDLAPNNTVTNALGSTQFILNRICTTPAVSASAAESTASTSSAGSLLTEQLIGT